MPRTVPNSSENSCGISLPPTGYPQSGQAIWRVTKKYRSTRSGGREKGISPFGLFQVSFRGKFRRVFLFLSSFFFFGVTTENRSFLLPRDPHWHFRFSSFVIFFVSRPEERKGILYPTSGRETNRMTKKKTVIYFFYL